MDKHLKFIFTTDLHGNINKYKTVLKYVLEHNIKLLHIGADILPKGSEIQKKQEQFIKGYLKNFYAECAKNGIKVLAFFGNDDLYTRKQQFKEYADLLDELPYRQNGYLFKAYGYVPDHHFNLKNGTKLDKCGLKPVKLMPRKLLRPFYNENEIEVPAKGVDVNDKGLYEIEDIEEYFKYKGSIEDDLNNLRVGSTTIIAVHTPPSGLNLDVCGKFRKVWKPKPSDRVGSDALLKWIYDKQPLLVLCGHIHENFMVTGAWRAEVGRTTVIQPGQHLTWREGQEKKTTLVDIEIINNKIKAERIEIASLQ